jgi:3-phenylpropionate/cinnamic acid dioxygenase small subunit
VNHLASDISKSASALPAHSSAGASVSLRERLMEFHASYIRCIDTDALEQWPGHFAEKCLYSVTTAENVREGLAAGLMWANSRAMLEDRITALRHANIYERQSYRHIVGLPYVLRSEPVEAECETPFIVARIVAGNNTDLFATGIYKDVFDLRAEKLVLKQRIVVCDSTRIDTLLAIPL